MIKWGNGVNGDALLAALVAANTAEGTLKGRLATLTLGDATANPVKPASTAADVAEALAKFTSTVNADAAAGDIDAVAKLIAETSGVLNDTNKISFTENNKEYTADVIGDGYYFIKDVTTTANLEGTTGSDTLSKYLLEVIGDTKINAKDTGITPSKKIVDGNEKVAADSAAIGDTVTFEVTIPVPNTKKYIDHFIFDMKDKLPAGMTFMGITSVKVGSADVPYTLTVAPAGSETYDTYTAPASAAAAVTTAGGQQIKLVFNNFKANAEAANPTWIGQNMVITYTAVVNKNADFTSTGNENEVKFDYSNDPNHDYDGDIPTGNDPMGETPESKTVTKLINIEILKVGDGDTTKKLEGAEFTITSSEYTTTLVTGEKFELSTYTPDADKGETAITGTWYKLADGTYTQTAPTDDTKAKYDNEGKDTYQKIACSDVVTTPTGTTKTISAVTNSDGKIVLEGLNAGTYTIKETKAPAGYNLDTSEYTIKINWVKATDKVAGHFEKDSTSSSDVTFTDTTATASLTINNNSGTTLPSTGGIGTTIFYVVGSILVVAAGVLLITKKRMSREG